MLLFACSPHAGYLFFSARLSCPQSTYIIVNKTETTPPNPLHSSSEALFSRFRSSWLTEEKKKIANVERKEERKEMKKNLPEIRSTHKKICSNLVALPPSCSLLSHHFFLSHQWPRIRAFRYQLSKQSARQQLGARDPDIGSRSPEEAISQSPTTEQGRQYIASAAHSLGEEG